MNNTTAGTFMGLILGLLIAVPIILFSGAAVFWFALDSSAGEPDRGSVEILVRRGESISEVSSALESKGLVKSGRYIELRFKVVNRLGLISPIQAGRYSLPFGLKPSQLLKNLTSPDGALRSYTTLTIPPGLTSVEIADRVGATGLATADAVLQAIQYLAAEYPIIRNSEGLQGYMYPDTYKIEKPIDESIESSTIAAETIVRAMTDNFFETMDEIDPSWKQLTTSQLHEKITLASIVEREYRREEEAPKIAAVFNNRITEGMPLQSCATVVYTIQNTEVGQPFRNEYLKYNRRIFERYLDISSPYNTYDEIGLPPGPISAPGRTALDSAFFPADIDALFFVVKDPTAGTHTFTRDYSDHLAARDTYLNQYVVKD
jgi:UPF0755 protein